MNTYIHLYIPRFFWKTWTPDNLSTFRTRQASNFSERSQATKSWCYKRVTLLAKHVISCAVTEIAFGMDTANTKWHTSSN